MDKGRWAAFRDGVIAIIITGMVLELRPPQRADPAALRPWLPIFLSYVLSFVQLGIYRHDHPHLCQAMERVNGLVLWADFKGRFPIVLSAIAIPLAFANSWIACAVFVLIAAPWLVPDPRIEQRLHP
ncbi:MAG TPA: TMEM175 family protein [Anaerolineales bacterium]|nr:TMEM175 family protein [Anaerolineales bacterium]